MFCPECGATDVEMIDGICKNCFLKKFQLMEIPENISVTICKHCNAKLEEGKWKDEYIPEEEIIYRALERNITISDLAENEEIELEIDQMRGTIAECYVEAVATVLGEELVETHTPDVKINYSVCPDCSKRNAGYYEAVIQLRADDRELKEEEMEKALEDFRAFDYILVDTAGHSQKNAEQKELTEGFLSSVGEEYEKEVFLVLSANTKYRDLLEIADTYKKMTQFKLIFTKLDETSALGCLLNLKLYTGASLCYITNGQNVPGDLEEFNPQKVVKLLLGGKN